MVGRNKKAGTVLVVDDDEIYREICTSGLSGEGYVVLTATNGLECLDIARANKIAIDLIILDVIMPKLDGHATLEKLRADPELQKIPVVMLTGKVEGEDAVKALQLGADDYIRKPFNIEELLARARIFVRRCHLERLLSHNVHAAAVLQQRLLTSEAAVHKIFGPIGWEVAIFNRPAYEVSGDFFYPKPISEKSGGLLLADSMGHGTAAAMLSMRVLSKVEYLRSPLRAASEFLGAINMDILPIMRSAVFGTFSALYAIFSQKGVVISNAGLPWPIMIDGDGSVSRLEIKGGLPLGISDDLYADTEIILPPGGRLILYTDGVIESMNREVCTIYGNEGLIRAVEKHHSAPLAEMPQLLAEEVKTFTCCEGFEDDVTIIAIQRQGSGR